MALGVVWVLANGLVIAGTDEAARIFWFKFQVALMLPMITATLCFVIEYAGLGRWLTLRMLVLFALVPLAFALLIFTNELHHLVWTRISFDGSVRADRGLMHWGAIAYGYLLSLLHLMVLVHLFVKSPAHRWIAIGLILAFFGTRGASLFNTLFRNPVDPLNPMVLVLNIALLPYVFAIVRYRMFDVVPVARDRAIEWMTEGLMVLDAENRVADVNKTAQALLGIARSRTVGRRVAEVLDAWPDLLDCVLAPGETEREIFFGDLKACWHDISVSNIIDRRGFRLGRLILFRNITERKKARTQILDQERTLAMLRERELLAQELHDGIGQAASAAHMQVACAREFLARGDTASVESCLRSLAEATQEVKKSVSDYLLGVKTGSSPEEGFLTGIQKYIEQYSRKYGIHVELVAPLELREYRIDPAIEAQVRPIVQEALTNVRKHSVAQSARVILTPSEDQLRVTIEDDGPGFDPEEISDNHGFGLRSMSGRAKTLGATLEVSTMPGKGTVVSLQVAWRKGGYESSTGR